MKGWKPSGGEVAAAIKDESRRALNSYREQPLLIAEHAAQERETKSGGYGTRQVFELIQNGVDQLQEGDGRRIQVVLTDHAFYCANSGRPFSADGALSILHAYLSQKDDEQIGRFGLGFKSVLGVTEEPMVLSRSGSFRFSAAVAESIRGVEPSTKDVPLLRIAEPFDPKEVFGDDPVARELAEWSATIIRLPLDSRGSAGVPWLANDVAAFPSAFLVFAGIVETLVLEDRTSGQIREITASKDGEKVRVSEGSKTEDWVVFQSEVKLSESARKNAGKLGDREAVTLKWAVPTSEKKGEGQFWSYFPTYDRTTLKGVLNAPWQLNQDRTNLVETAYNREIVKGASGLVAESLSDLRKATGGGLEYLSFLPGRGKEGRNWADDLLTEETNQALSERPSVPLIDGRLETPARANIHPPDLPEEALDLWTDLADTTGWVHHRVDGARDYRARVERYLKGVGRVPEKVEDWFRAAIPSDPDEAPSQEMSDLDETLADELVDPENAGQKAARLVRLAGFLESGSGSQESSRLSTERLRDMEIILGEDGVPHAASNPKLMIPGAHQPHDSSVVQVCEAIAADEVAVSVLIRLGVERVSAEGELRRLVDNALPQSNSDWEHFWSVVRELHDEISLPILKTQGDFVLRVRVVSGEFKNMKMCLLPGRCISEDDAESTVDQHWHRAELNLLQALGCDDQPRPGKGHDDEAWFAEYQHEAVKVFTKSCLPATISPASATLETPSFVGPLMPLRGLSENGRSKFTEVMIEHAGEFPATFVRHTTQTDRYKKVRFPGPVEWMIRSEGRFATAWGPLPPADSISPNLAFGDLTPAANCSTDVAAVFDLPEEWAELDEELIGRIIERSLDAEVEMVAPLYGSLAKARIAAPSAVRCRGGGAEKNARPDDVMVCWNIETKELLEGGSASYLYLADRDAAQALIENWSMQDAADLLSTRIARSEQGEPIPLVDAFPALKRSLEATDRDIELLRCDEIRVIEEIVGMGTRSKVVDFVRDGEFLLCSDELDDHALLKHAAKTLDLELGDDGIERIIRNAEDDRIKKLKKASRGAESDAERLLTLLGEDAIAAGIPETIRRAYESIYRSLEGEELAELALSVHGVEVLRRYEGALEDQGISSPLRWGGRRPAKEFVRSLGFSEELAGFEKIAVADVEIIEGRPDLPPLHDYQESIVAELCDLFAVGRGQRSMLVLPTGAGKTRVAVEGTIRAMNAGLVDPWRILWVAQTGELCEQAVQAWSELWRSQGMEQSLTIGRLWASRSVEEVTSDAQVVVATIQQLKHRIDDPDYEWLTESGAVFIDEAHGSITPSYTRLLSWLGLGAKDKNGPPLIGLSATPYRGRDSKETERLAKRYGQGRLDIKALGGGDQLTLLQEQGVISRVKHRILDGMSIELEPSELESLKTTRLVPKTADTRIGRDADRTESILTSIAGLPDDWPILVFAPSVENSQALAGLLNHQGIPAASISTETSPEARRWYIDEFKRGEIRVITNYNVLAEGFDAPAVRAVYVARPVYATNRYQQMVGRGLRGTKNGGKEECLIVDVKDNIVSFDGKLAFHEFEYLWEPEMRAALAES